LDFAKAFDKVPHVRLLSKIRAHGITGKIASWIEAWLQGRQQRVVLNGASSDWEEVSSGVPQGSVLGPALFVLFINDIDTAVDLVGLFLSKFADDTKAARVVDTDEDVQKLQEDLDGLAEWARTWQMLFNVDKCKVIHVGRNNAKHDYLMEGKKLIVVEEEKDLGVKVHQSLKTSSQVGAAAKKANNALGQLLRAFTYRDKVHFIRLFQTYVRCHLEYAVASWSPWLEQDINVLEDVQRRAIRQVRGLTGSYEEKLEQVGLTTLVDRRLRGDMIQTYKIINQVDRIEVSTFFQMAGENHHHATRQAVTFIPEEGEAVRSLSIVKPRANLEIRKNFYSHRVIDKWNSLPFEVKTAETVNSF
jgi:ribonuclease P/MRP protein subunit RPP40